MKFDDEVGKQLDAVVGESYDPPRNWRATIAKWAAAVLLAVATSAGVIAILDTHATRAQASAAAKRPVNVQLLPPAKPGEPPAQMPARPPR